MQITNQIDLTQLQGLICVCGNDGCGKTSTARLINQQFPNTHLYAFQRSTKPSDAALLELKTKVSPKLIDDVTFIYPWQERPQLCTSVTFKDRVLPVYWIMLDVEIPEIERRIKGRMEMTIYEVRKCLQYYQRVYRELAAYYGLPLLPTDGVAPQMVAKEVIDLIQNGFYKSINALAFNHFSIELIEHHDVQKLLEKAIEGNELGEKTVLPEDLTKELYYDGMYQKTLEQLVLTDKKLRCRLLAKWLTDKGQIKSSGQGQFTITHQSTSITIKSPWLLKLIIQGQSKKLFKIILPNNNHYFDEQVVIILKSTIYSHTMQHTGLIENLGKIRARGSQIFVDLMTRNELKHAYRCVNSNGVILSDFKDITPLEVVFKKYWVGTDKHSFFGVNDQQYGEKIVKHSNNCQYSNGIYIRFDWRNPNHVALKTQTATSANPYYYLLEEYFGKDKFFETYLRDPTVCKPFGDKCIYPDIVTSICDIPAIRKEMLKLYCTFQYYFSELELEIIDGCFMLNKTGSVFWSEINPDCMRIRASSMDVKYDKDIWRAGGSSSKDQITKKWTFLNELFMKYLAEHRFHLTELHDYNYYPYQIQAKRVLEDRNISLTPEYKVIYKQLINPHKKKRQVIVTIDIHNQQPSLVKSSEVFEHHSQGKVDKALAKLQTFFDNILLVDLNGALKDSKQSSTANRAIIKIIACNKTIMTGGGIHTLEDVKQLLDSGISQIVIASNTDKSFLDNIPKDRLIVELSINEEFEVMTEGRKVNTKVKAVDKVKELIGLGVQNISVTFVKSQGHLKGLDRVAIRKLLVEFPRVLKKIIIAGGITSMDDLQFLWSFDRVVPQLGSAIWKNKITPGEILSEIANYDEHELISAIILSDKKVVKGQVFMSKEAILKTCETGKLYRYSREHKRVMMKGETSGDIQLVQHLAFDCDSDCLLVTVDSGKNFCHNGCFSCFDGCSRK